MKLLTINGLLIGSIPESWNELSKKQLLTLCSLVVTSYDRQSLLIKLLLVFAKLRFCQNNNAVYVNDVPHYWLKISYRKKALISVNDLAYAASPLEFIFTEEDGVIRLTSHLFENKLPFIKIGRTKLYGPDHALFNISFSEFIKLQTLYFQYSKTKDPIVLDRIVAVMYRCSDKSNKPNSPSFSGDIRVPFNDFLVDGDSSFVKILNSETKLAIFLFLEGCLWFIFKGSKLFEHAFTESETESNNSPPLHEFNKLINALSNDDPAHMKEIRQTPAYDIFYQLDALVLRNKKLNSKHNV